MIPFSFQLVLCGPLLAQSFQQTLRDIVSGWRGDTSRVVLLKSGERILSHHN